MKIVEFDLADAMPLVWYQDTTLRSIERFYRQLRVGEESTELSLCFRDSTVEWWQLVAGGNWLHYRGGEWCDGSRPASLEGEYPSVVPVPVIAALGTVDELREDVSPANDRKPSEAIEVAVRLIVDSYRKSRLIRHDAEHLLGECHLLSTEGDSLTVGALSGSWYANRGGTWERVSTPPEHGPTPNTYSSTPLALPEPVTPRWSPPPDQRWWMK